MMRRGTNRRSPCHRVGPGGSDDCSRACARSRRSEAGPRSRSLVASQAAPPSVEGLLAGWVRWRTGTPPPEEPGGGFRGRRLPRVSRRRRGRRPRLDRRAVEKADDLRSLRRPRSTSPDAPFGTDLGSPARHARDRFRMSRRTSGRRGAGVSAAPRTSRCATSSSRARLFDSLGGFDESLGYIGEDTDFVRRAMAAGEIRPCLDPESSSSTTGAAPFRRRFCVSGGGTAGRPAACSFKGLRPCRVG